MSVAPKEHPISFYGPMVRAILAGDKTQVRKVVKPQPKNIESTGIRSSDGSFYVAGRFANGENAYLNCPYGQPGARLWVRETHRFVNALGEPARKGSRQNSVEVVYKAASGKNDPYYYLLAEWRRPVHMPRWASRILLEVVSIKVERLQDISEADAFAEGLSLNDAIQEKVPTARDVYRYRSESLHGKFSWAANPFVWVVEFKRLVLTK